MRHLYLQLGNLKLHRVDDGGFRLDGGAMFGVVPKNLVVAGGAGGRGEPHPTWAPTAC